ncbi:MAG: hypothetical protein M1829_001573 [Trizodia sp. TS-e1964]|nr:MAG: hypothetical protein M1829_001573 [Trizodia sp. TS-e1964]
MPALSYGLNISKKNAPKSTRPLPGKRKAVFGDDSDDDAEVKEWGAEGGPEVEIIEEIGGITPTSSPSKAKAADAKTKQQQQIPKHKKDVSTLYGSLSAKTSTLKYAQTAIEIDPTIYDYDAVYDSLHANSRKKKAAQDGDKKPQYMDALLAAAEVRKRDQLRAKEKLLQREREAEGDEFADKEMFVTEAYKLQQAELLKIEAEEAAREEREAERRRREGGGMAGFYKKLLDQGEKAHVEAVAAAAEAVIPTGTEEAPEQPKEKSEAELAKELMDKKGGVIAVNDDGQIVDKRQLLSAGLNIVAKPKSAATAAASTMAASGSRQETSQYGIPSRGGGQKAMRERQSRMIEEQLAQATKRAADEEADKARELERTSKSRKTGDDISGAKERYLQRKREAAAAAAAAKAK